MTENMPNNEYVIVSQFRGFSVDFVEEEFQSPSITTDQLNEAKVFTFERAKAFCLRFSNCRMIPLSKALELSSATIASHRYEDYLESLEDNKEE